MEMRRKNQEAHLLPPDEGIDNVILINWNDTLLIIVLASTTL
jgi:hypothetical protein